MNVNLDHFPKDRGENEKYVKPPPSIPFAFYQTPFFQQNMLRLFLNPTSDFSTKCVQQVQKAWHQNLALEVGSCHPWPPEIKRMSTQKKATFQKESGKFVFQTIHISFRGRPWNVPSIDDVGSVSLSFLRQFRPVFRGELLTSHRIKNNRMLRLSRRCVEKNLNYL